MSKDTVQNNKLNSLETFLSLVEADIHRTFKLLETYEKERSKQLSICVFILANYRYDCYDPRYQVRRITSCSVVLLIVRFNLNNINPMLR
jgi:hypothetical protein